MTRTARRCRSGILTLKQIPEFVDELYVKHDPVDPKTELLIKANL